MQVGGYSVNSCCFSDEPSGAGQSAGSAIGASVGGTGAGVTDTTSITNVSASPGLITSPAPWSPYASEAGMSSWRRPPALTPIRPSSQPCDHAALAERERVWLAAVVAVVELGAVLGPHADVVDGDRVALLGRLAGALDQVGDDELGRELGGEADRRLAVVDGGGRRLRLWAAASVRCRAPAVDRRRQPQAARTRQDAASRVTRRPGPKCMGGRLSTHRRQPRSPDRRHGAAVVAAGGVVGAVRVSQASIRQRW